MNMINDAYRMALANAIQNDWKYIYMYEDFQTGQIYITQEENDPDTMFYNGGIEDTFIWCGTMNQLEDKVRGINEKLS